MKTSPTPWAVIELGTTSIRMEVADVSSAGEIKTLDELQQAVSLGRDTLVSGSISPENTESCVSALHSFRRLLDEYGMTGHRNVRLVATSAVREASNREAFRDRILIATGFDAEILDQAEVNRLTYRAVRPQLKKKAFFNTSNVLVIEVGGGSTETLLFRKGKVNASHMHSLGALRLRTLMEEMGAAPARAEKLMRDEMAQTLNRILDTCAPDPARLLLLGAEARFAATQMRPSWDRTSLCRLKVADMRAFIRTILGKTVDDVAAQFNLTYPDAETMGPALLIYLCLLEEMKNRTVLVGDATLRKGILLELATGELWTGEFKRQVINSALAIARRHGVNLTHAHNVAQYALRIRDALQKRNDPGSARDEVVLHVAALLHEVGLAVNSSDHPKHSHYLIRNSDIFGLRKRDIELAALVARYHHGDEPTPDQPEYAALPREDRIAVLKLAAVLHVANGLDHERIRKPMKLDMHIQENEFIITVETDRDLSLVERRVEERSKLFARVFGKKAVIRARLGPGPARTKRE